MHLHGEFAQQIDLRKNVGNKSSFLKKLSLCSLFKGFSGFNATAWRRPISLSSQGSGLKDEVKQKDFFLFVQNEEPG